MMFDEPITALVALATVAVFAIAAALAPWLVVSSLLGVVAFVVAVLAVRRWFDRAIHRLIHGR